MTQTEAKQRGFTSEVKLSRWDGQWYYREPRDKAPKKPEFDGLRDRLGAIVYRLPESDSYFDLPQRAERLLLD